MKKNDRTQLLLENELLFNAVIDEFAKKTYLDSSINEIIKNAKYNKGSFYYRFDSKKELYCAMMDHIIVEQISLFKERNISLSRITKIEDTLFELYNNLILLYYYNKNYFYILTKGLGDSETNQIITENCIGPLINRFLVHLNRFSGLPHFDNLTIVVKNLYYNFPTDFLFDRDYEKKLKEFVGYLVSNDHKTSKKALKSIRIENFQLEDRVTYILTNFFDFNYPKDWISISHDFLDSKTLIASMQRKVGLFTWSYKSTVLKLIRKSIKDISYYQKFVNREIVKKVRTNQDFKILLLLILFRALQDSPIIVIDHVFDKFSQEEIKLFFRDILPIISKTSKIVILNDKYEFSHSIPKFFILNQSLELIEHRTENVTQNLNNALLIDYLDGDTLHTELIKEEDIDSVDIKHYLNNYKQINIKTITSIAFDSLAKSEELI